MGPPTRQPSMGVTAEARTRHVARFAFPPCPLGPPQGWGWVTLIPSPPPGPFSVLLFTLESPSFYLFIFFGGEAASQLLSYCDLSFPGGACDSPGCWASGAIVYRRPRRGRSGLLASTSRPQRGGRGGHAGAGVTPWPPGPGLRGTSDCGRPGDLSQATARLRLLCEVTSERHQLGRSPRRGRATPPRRVSPHGPPPARCTAPAVPLSPGGAPGPSASRESSRCRRPPGEGGRFAPRARGPGRCGTRNEPRG